MTCIIVPPPSKERSAASPPPPGHGIVTLLVESLLMENKSLEAGSFWFTGICKPIKHVENHGSHEQIGVMHPQAKDIRNQIMARRILSSSLAGSV